MDKMSFSYGTEEYYQKIIELQDKLRKSEEDRLKLEIQFNEMVTSMREEEQTNFRKMRSRYKRYVEEDKFRHERNDKILHVLERIEDRASALAEKTEKFKEFRKQYHQYLQYMPLNNTKPFMSQQEDLRTHQRPPDITEKQYSKQYSYGHPDVHRTIFFDKPPESAPKTDFMQKYLSSQELKKDILQKDLRNERYPYTLPPETYDDYKAIKGQEIGNATDGYNQVLCTTMAQNKAKLDYVKNSDFDTLTESQNKEKRDSFDLKITKDFENVLKQNPKLSETEKTRPTSDYYPKDYMRYQNDIYDDPKLISTSTIEDKNDSKSYIAPSFIVNTDQKMQEVPNDSVYRYANSGDSQTDKDLRTKTQLHQPELPLPEFQTPMQRRLSKVMLPEQYYQNTYLDSELTRPQPPLVQHNKILQEESNGVENISTHELAGQLNQCENKTMNPTPVPRRIEESKDLQSSLTRPGSSSHILKENIKTINQLPDEEISKQFTSKILSPHEDVGKLQTAEKNIEDHIKKDHPPPQTLRESIQYDAKDPLQQKSAVNVPEIPKPNNLQYDENEQPSQLHDETDLAAQEFADLTQPQQEYDENEKLQQQYYDDNGMPLMQYDDNGQPVQETIENVESLQQFNKNEESVEQYPESAQALQTNSDVGEQLQQYDEQGKPLQQYAESTQPLQQYDESGQLLQGYNESGPPLQQYDESGQVLQYDENGQPLQPYDASGQELQYDDSGQLMKQYGENGQNLQYDEAGQPIQQYDENGQALQYDESGQALQFDESGQALQYDESGQVIQYDESGQVIQYDENRQPLPQYDQTDQILQQYDENGQPLQQYDESGQVIQYDENGQQLQQYDESGQILQQYDANGQPLQQYDENGQPLMQYDENGQPLQQYDENGQPLMQYDENGQTVQYDENGQPIPYFSEQQYDESGQPIQNYEGEYQEQYDQQLQEQDNMAVAAKKPSVLDMLDTDTESIKQDTKVSNDSDFDFSNS